MRTNAAQMVACAQIGRTSSKITSPPINPANMASVHPNIYCVAACGPQKERSFYSSDRPYTTISCPGGDDPTFADPTKQILSTIQVSMGSYGVEQGTSMAAPHFAGILGLMLSVKGLPSEIRPAVIATADSVGQVIPNKDIGFGVVVADQAVLRVAAEAQGA